MIKNNKKSVIDYYIFIDYSDDIIGYNIIEKKNVQAILQKIVKFRHYKEQRHKKTYLIKIKREIKKTGLKSLLLKQKIKDMKDNLIIFAEVIEHIQKHDNCLIFMSVDNNQFNSFNKLLYLVPHKQHIIIKKESELKTGSLEYKLSLIIDTTLNIERMSK